MGLFRLDHSFGLGIYHLDERLGLPGLRQTRGEVRPVLGKSLVRLLIPFTPSVAAKTRCDAEPRGSIPMMHYRLMDDRAMA